MFKRRILKKEILFKACAVFFTAMSVLFVFSKRVFCQSLYPLLPIPPEYISPAAERGQIALDGIVKKISLFHGRGDDEADWHVYIELDAVTKNRLADYVSKELQSRNPGIILDYSFNEVYSELMVLDKYENVPKSLTHPFGDEYFYSADVTKPFLLKKAGSTHPAWDIGYFATRHQGGSNLFYTNNLNGYSNLDGGRAYLQGVFVNDKEHEINIAGKQIIKKAEIHPLDAIAFAMDKNGNVYSGKYGQPNWAKSYVRWRVAFFANSGYHRINGEYYLKGARTTTFYLDLPDEAYKKTGEAKLYTISCQRKVQRLWDGAGERYYDARGWQTFPIHSIEVDSADGRKKLKVTAVMKPPDKFGGIVVCDYIITTGLPVAGH